MPVGLVIVSHSVKIAEGVVDLAGQMAPGVAIVAAGGTDDAGIGTSFAKVTAAVAVADDGAGVVVLCDLGSAILTAETALDFLDDDLRTRVRIADGPLVEGSVAAAVAAEIGGDLDDVVGAAEAGTPAALLADDRRGGSAGGATGATVTGVATLVNTSGLHARPASEFVRLASEFDARVAINGVDAKSLLSIMGLGLGKGTEVQLEATGAEARQAIDALVILIGSGFGE